MATPQQRAKYSKPNLGKKVKPDTDPGRKERESAKKANDKFKADHDAAHNRKTPDKGADLKGYF